MHPRVAQLPHPVRLPFVARVRPAGVKLSGHPPKPASHSIGGRYVKQPYVATHTGVDAVVAPTQRHGAIGNKPNPILPDRHQQPATLRPIRRLPVRDQPFSGDSMPTPVSPDTLKYVLVGYNHNIVAYLLNGLPAQQHKGITNLKSAVEFPAVLDSEIAK